MSGCGGFSLSYLQASPCVSEVSQSRESPTNPFIILEPRDQEIGEFYVVEERRATDFEAPKLWKGSSGE